MPTFRLDGRPYQVPGTWAELLPVQFFAAAPYLGIDSPASRYRVLRLWCLELTQDDVYLLGEEQLWDLTNLVGWAWTQELAAPDAQEFAHRGQVYRLPEPGLRDAPAIEYAMALVYFRRFAFIEHLYPLTLEQMLAHLVAILCRPRCPGPRVGAYEKYDTQLVEARVPELFDVPVAVKIVVLYHFIGAQRLIHRDYNGLFEQDGDGMEMLELVAGRAASGEHGTYEEVAQTSLYTVLAEEARSRRVAEKF